MPPNVVYYQKEITTKHVFLTKKQRQYPQTRKVVLTPARGKKKYTMSSPGTYIDQSEDELEHYNRTRLGSNAQTFSSGSVHTTPGLYSNQIVQEVSLSYSAPLTVSPREVPLTVSISQGDHIDDYGQINSGGSLQDYLSHYEAKVSKPRHIESVERVTTTGRHETEFPVRVAYIGGDPIHTVPISVVNIGHPYKVYDNSRASTPRLASGLTDVIVSETTTIEEMTTITTTNNRRGGGSEMMSPNSVNSLKQQFEQTARREHEEAQKSRRTPTRTQSPPAPRIAVNVNRTGGEYTRSEERVRRVDRQAFSPTGHRERVSTTIVDIDPAYRSSPPRYIEETYQVQEEFRTIKSYGGSKSRERILSPEPTRNEFVKEAIREHVSISRSSSPAREREPEVSRGTTPVRSVVEQFEEKIEGEARRAGVERYGKAEIEEYTIVKKEQKPKPSPPKEVYIPRGDYIPSRQPLSISPTPTPEPTPRPVTPKEVIIPTRTPEPRPQTPKEIEYPKAPSPKPPPKEVEISQNKSEDDRSFMRTNRNLKVDTWEEITTSRRRAEPIPKEEVPIPESKKEEPKVLSSTPQPDDMFSSSTYETTVRTTTRDETNRSYKPPPPPPVSSMSNRTMTDYASGTAGYRSVYQSSGYSVGSGAGTGKFRIPADLATGTLSGLSPFGQNAASAIRDAREREKKEMSDLNDRLASYIEKVRFLEAQNRKLANDLELLTSRWGSDSSSVRVMYETELKTAKVVIDDSNRQREALENDIRRLSTELVEYRKKYEEAVATRETARHEADDLLSKLAKIEAEINLIKRKITYLEEEVNRIKRENLRLVGELTRTRSTIEQESLSRIDFQNQVQTLIEECQYVNRVHSSELGDLVVLAHRDTTPENREYFKHELAAAIRDIRAEYDQITHSNRTDMESWYKVRVQEIHSITNRNAKEQNYAKEEVKKLRITLTEMRSKLADLESRNALLQKQISELNYQIEDDQRSYEAALNERDGNIRLMRDECQTLMVELQMLLDTKQTLDAEIAIYRKMLEGEENRAGLRQLVEQVVKTSSYGGQHSTESVRVVTSETSSRSNFQRSAKGNVSVHETSPDGRFIVIENTHRSKDENIGEWKLKRRIDGKKEYVYTFPKDFILKPLKSVKIFARGQGVHSPPDSLIFDGEDNWGTGNNVQTFLYNKEGEERATLTQRQSYN